jgi:hypothetical protein
MVTGIFGADSSFIDGMNHCNSVPNKGFHIMDASIRGAWHYSFQRLKNTFSALVVLKDVACFFMRMALASPFE